MYKDHVDKVLVVKVVLEVCNSDLFLSKIFEGSDLDIVGFSDSISQDQ